MEQVKLLMTELSPEPVSYTHLDGYKRQVYWLARMLEAGEDPLYVARRLVRFASEDVGLADSLSLIHICGVYGGRPKGPARQESPVRR